MSSAPENSEDAAERTRACDARRQQDYERFLTLQPRFEGARALYREGMGISLVRVAVIQAKPDRLIAGIELIPTRGLYNERPPKWPVSVTWDVFGFTPDSWGCGYISMTAYFDSGLIDAVVAQAAVAEPEEYSRERKLEIWEWMRDYRRSILAKHRRQTLALTWQGQPVAQLSDHWLSEYPEVSSRVETESLAPELRAALASYGAWWNADEDDRESPASPFGEKLFVGWEVITPDGKRFGTSIPKFDFAGGRVEWRCGGVVGSEGA